MAPSRVTAVDADSCEIQSGGQMLRVSRLFAPDVSVGDWVLVNGGAIVRRLEPDQAEAMSRAVDVVFASEPSAEHSLATEH